MQVKIGIILLGVALAVVAASDVVRYLEVSKKQLETVEEKRLKALLPEAKTFEYDDKSPPCFSGKVDGKEIGAVTLSDRVDPKVIAYGGEMGILLALTADGIITGTRVLSHNETPAYLYSVKASGFFDRFVGRKVTDDLSDVQAVTGATVTCDAARADILTTARSLARERFGFQGLAQPQTSRFHIIPQSIIALLIVAGFAIAAYFSRKKILRWLSWIASVIVLGFWLNISVSLPQIVALLRLEIPGGSQPEPLILLALAAGFAFFRNPFYCKQLCPFGAAQEMIYRITPGKLSPRPRLQKALRPLRWALLFVIIIAAAAVSYSPAASIEPFGSLFSLSTPAPLLFFAIFVLLLSVGVRRFWCRFFCPTGACLDLIAGKSESSNAPETRQGVESEAANA